jgi:hypothetical protein
MILYSIQTVKPAAARAVQHVGARTDQLRSHGTFLPAPAQDGESLDGNPKNRVRVGLLEVYKYSTAFS